MPRPRSLQPSYCRHVSSGRAFVRVGGRQVWLGKFGTQASKDQYLSVLAEWVAKGRPADDTKTPTQQPSTHVQVTAEGGIGALPAGPTLTVVIEPYWNFAQGYYRKNGRPTDEVACIKVVLRLLRQLFGELPAREFDSLKMLAVQQAMIDRGWARKTINSHLGRLKRCLKWLASRKYIPAGVYHEALTVAGLERGRSKARETDRKKPVPQEHVDAVLPFLSRQVAAMVRIELLCGCRPGELVSMRKMDLDRSRPVWTYTPPSHKTEHHDHERTIFIGPEAQAILTPFLMRPDDKPLFSPAEAERERRAARHAARKTPIGQGNRPGTNKRRHPRRPPAEAYTVDTYRQAVARAVEKANRWARGGRICANDAVLIPHWHPHRLRHNCATAVRERYGAEAAKLAIGVKSLDVAEIYAERDQRLAERIAAEVG